MDERTRTALLAVVATAFLGCHCDRPPAAGKDGHRALEALAPLPARATPDCRASAVPLSSQRVDFDGDGHEEQVEIVRTGFTFPILAHWRPGNDEADRDEIWVVATHQILTVRPGVIPAALRNALERLGPEPLRLTPLSLPNTYLLGLADEREPGAGLKVPQLLRAYESVAAAVRGEVPGPLPALVRRLSPDYLYVLDQPNGVEPGDEQFPGQTDLKEVIGGPQAWTVTTGSPDVRVAIIDSGLDVGHPDLDGNLLRDANGNIVSANFIQGGTGVVDAEGHGTRCAGIIGAEGDSTDGQGIAGVNWRVSMIPIKAFQESCGCVSQVSQAFQFAIDHGAHIISCSWGGPDSEELRQAVEAANDAQVLVVASAGNSDVDLDDDPYYPASYTAAEDGLPNVVSVAASAGDGRLPGTGHAQLHVHLSAPGQGVLTTVPRAEQEEFPYGEFGFSSAATAFVSGAAALVKSTDGSLSPGRLRTILIDSADVLLPGLTGASCSEGRLNLERAVKRRLRLPASGC